MTLKERYNLIFFLFAAIITAYFIYGLRLPFFYDMEYIASVADYIYKHDFQSIINPLNDNGTPPLYSIYIASLWKIFGKSLWVAHLGILPFFVGLLYQFYQFSLRFISKRFALVALILLIVDPSFSTQFLLMGYDIIIVFLFLWALNSIYTNKLTPLIISTVLIPLLNLRGFSIVVSLFMIDIYINHRYRIGSLLYGIIRYLPSAIILILWLGYHYNIQHWYAVSPANTAIHHINSSLWILKNTFFEAFAFISNGRVFILIAILLLLLLNKNNLSKDKRVIQLVIVASLSIIPFILIFTPMQYPMGPRYFMIIYPLMYLFFVLLLEESNIKHRIALLLITISLLFASNIWTNPYPYSNSWDSSLKVISYLNNQNQLLRYAKENNWHCETVLSTFPLHKSLANNYVTNNKSICFKEYNGKAIQKGDYILYSNIYNNLELRKPENRPKNSHLVLTIKEYPSWIKLYKVE